MDIYDDLERFKQQIQQNTHFQQFESSRGHEMTKAHYAIFNQLDEHYFAQAQDCAHLSHLNGNDAEHSPSFDANLITNRVTEKTSEASIFDSVSKISSKQSLERLLHSAGLSQERESTLVMAGNE